MIHIITGEFPPQLGGVSDYTETLARALARMGEDVHVWCPPVGAPVPPSGVTIHESLGALAPRDLHRASQQLDRYPVPRQLLVQWVPHAFGYRSMNLCFCVWLWSRVRRGDRIELMVHEPFLAFREGSRRQDAVAAVHRVMISIVLSASSRVWVSIPEWERRLRPFVLRGDPLFESLPIPSNVEPLEDREGVAAIRRACCGDGYLLIGHFGTYGQPIVRLLEPIVRELIQNPSVRLVLIGAGSELFSANFLKGNPRARGRIHATGCLPGADVSRHLSACDLLIQPFPDGASARRTTVMAALSHGIPVVSTRGHLTAPLWDSCPGVALAPVGDTSAFLQHVRALQADVSQRTEMGRRGRDFYKRHFSMERTVSRLLREGPVKPRPVLDPD